MVRATAPSEREPGSPHGATDTFIKTTERISRFMADPHFLAEELGQVVIGLEDPRAPSAPDPGFEVGDPTAHQRGDDHDGEDLEDLDLYRRSVDCGHPHLHVTSGTIRA